MRQKRPNRRYSVKLWLQRQRARICPLMRMVDSTNIVWSSPVAETHFGRLVMVTKTDRVDTQTDETPRVRRDLVVHAVDNELLLYDRGANRAHRLNAAATRVWRLCDGSRSVAAIEVDLRDAGTGDAGTATMQALGQFRREGLLEGTQPRRL